MVGHSKSPAQAMCALMLDTMFFLVVQ